MTAPLPAWPYSPYIAHRGGGRLAPENTLAAMRVGAAHGFTMFEFDVKLSRDNVEVLLHDDDVDRTSNGHGPAASKTYAELAQLDAGSWYAPQYAGEPVPTFSAVARYAL
ncbi:glycerophosphodiester phosphodiesterase family protein, partial [Bordetella pertussis]